MGVNAREATKNADFWLARTLSCMWFSTRPFKHVSVYDPEMRIFGRVRRAIWYAVLASLVACTLGPMLLAARGRHKEDTVTFIPKAHPFDPADPDFDPHWSGIEFQFNHGLTWVFIGNMVRHQKFTWKHNNSNPYLDMHTPPESNMYPNGARNSQCDARWVGGEWGEYFGFGREDVYEYQQSSEEPFGLVPPVQSAIIFPTWLLSVPPGAILCGIFLANLRRRYRVANRLKNGQCPKCAFDLRAHAAGDRCPECGTAIG